MSRLIDADEYIEKLRDRIGIEPTWNHSGLRIAIFELHNMPTIDQARWIPVSERQPEIMATVLITNGGNSIEFGRLNNDDGWEWLFEAGYDYWAKCPAPEAWMPLPKPWRGEER